MPRVSAGFDTTDSKVTRKSNVPIGGSGDTISVDNSRYSKTLTLDQPIFNGGSSVAELKAAQSAFRASKGNYYAKEQNIFLDEITSALDQDTYTVVSSNNLVITCTATNMLVSDLVWRFTNLSDTIQMRIIFVNNAYWINNIDKF